MEFELLREFQDKPDRAQSRDPLLMHARNREWEPYARSIHIRIGRPRRNFEPEPEPDSEPRCTPTVRNVGCMFMPAN